MPILSLDTESSEENWFIPFSELEFTEFLGRGASGKVFPKLHSTVLIYDEFLIYFHNRFTKACTKVGMWP